MVVSLVNACHGRSWMIFKPPTLIARVLRMVMRMHDVEIDQVFTVVKAARVERKAGIEVDLNEMPFTTECSGLFP